MSKIEILRGFVGAKLAAASREILAAVDGLAAAYEAEASGFRQEIERQRRQLDLLLQSRVSINEAGVMSSRSLRPAEDEEDEEDEGAEDLEDSTNQTPSRRQTGETRSHVDLRIRILEDSGTCVLSNRILKKSPMLRLKCPRGLQEAEFLVLLKSTFPQLSGRNFDILTSDERRRLQPLRPKTPDEIHGNPGCSGRRRSTLFLRLKTKDSEDALSSSATLTCDGSQTSGSVQEVEGRSSTSQRAMETEEAADEDGGVPEPAEDLLSQDDAWKPEKSDEELKEPPPQKPIKPGSGVGSSESVLTCKVCGALHASEVSLAKHGWSHADDPGGVCGVCGDLSGSTEALKDHLQHRHKTHGRDACGESFLGPASLEDHPRFHQAAKVLELDKQLSARRRRRTHLCGVCGKSLSDFRSLSRHKMTHTGERPHSCQVCGSRFKLAGTLRQHEKIHTERERSYLCDVCCKMFLTSKQLQIHMRTHTNDKPYQCGECGKGFTTKGPLTVHMRVHTGEAPYRCPDCGWSFKRKTNLDDHVKVHSGQKPFVCGICGKACARKTYLAVHMRIHNGERPYKCSLCDKAFTQSHCLKTHMKSHLVAGAAT